jgi:NhaA family Na+:H+ antiporter
MFSPDNNPELRIVNEILKAQSSAYFLMFTFAKSTTIDDALITKLQGGNFAAALPIAAAIGGMVAPALIYLLSVPPGPWAIGWGVPMATDTAFAVALIAMLGARVPVELRIFLTAAAIVDDIGAIIVVAIFYSGDLHFGYLAGTLAITAMLALLNRSGIYRVTPYVPVGVALWVCVHAGGLHATLAGIILAAFIPTRLPPDYKTLAMQGEAILTAEAQHLGERFRHGPSAPALQALDAIHDRLESPADRMLRNLAPRSSYVVLPIFALANAGVAIGMDVFSQHEGLVLAIVAGLAIAANRWASSWPSVWVWLTNPGRIRGRNSPAPARWPA